MFKVINNYGEKEAMLRIAQVWQRKTREENQQKKRAKRNLIIWVYMGVQKRQKREIKIFEKTFKKVLTYLKTDGIINKSLTQATTEPWKLNKNLEKSECAGQAFLRKCTT